MSWLLDIVEFVGDALSDSSSSGSRSSSSSSSSATATGGNANVSVNPTIVNQLDIDAPIQKLVDVMAANSIVQAAAIERGAGLLAAAQAGRNQQLDQLAQWVSLGALGLGVYRLVFAK